jgi:hypothetical protein
MFAGRHQFHLGRIARARVLLLNAINLSSVLHINTGLGWAHAFLGDVYFVDGQMEEARRTYQRGLEIASVGAGDDYAAPLCAIGLAHHGAARGAEAAEVRRWADYALERVRAASNQSSLVVILQRYAESLAAMGDHEAVEKLDGERDLLIRKLGIDEPDFWPRIPQVATSYVASRRNFWQILVDPVQSAEWQKGAIATMLESGERSSEVVMKSISATEPLSRGVMKPVPTTQSQWDFGQGMRFQEESKLFTDLSTQVGYIPVFESKKS